MLSGELIMDSETRVCTDPIPILTKPKLLFFDVPKDVGFDLQFKLNGKQVYLFRYLKLMAGKTNVFMWDVTGKKSSPDNPIIDEFIVWGFSSLKIKYKWEFDPLLSELDYHVI